MTFKVAVVGASGFAGGEILRLLLSHPGVEVGALTAAASAGDLLGVHHPHLFPLADRVLQPTEVSVLAGHDVIFLALPHGASGEITRELRQAGNQAILIDTGADHRLTDPQDWRDYYHSEAAEAWTYSMPELWHRGEATPARRQRQALAKAREIAVPGCNVTAVTFALLPAVAQGLIDTSDIVANLAVGYSGAGKSLKPHLAMTAGLGNAQGYSMAGVHRHIPEVIQNLGVMGATNTRLSFTPVLVPMNRGILATVTAPLLDPQNANLDPGTATKPRRYNENLDPEIETKVRQAYEKYLEAEPLLELLSAGTWPTVSMVTGSAKAAIGVGVDVRAGKLVAQCAIDNLGKGTAAAALQGMNLALGIEELCGLPLVSTAP